MITQTVNFSRFCDAFAAYGREDSFTYEAEELIFKYYNEIESYELDIIEICSEWNETSIKKALSYFDVTEDELEAYLANNTIFFVLKNGNILYATF